MVMTKGEVPLRDEVYSKLKEAILHHDYAINDFLNERRISEMFLVSRTPVREALKHLEADGWVENVPYRGMRVKQLDSQEIDNLFQVRQALELIVIENVCGRLSQQGILKLDKCIHCQWDMSMRAKKDWTVFLDSDMEFHSILTSEQHNDVAHDYLDELRVKSRLINIRILYRIQGDIEKIYEQHRDMFKYIREGDEEQAKHYMRMHMEYLYDLYQQYIRHVKCQRKVNPYLTL